MRTTEGTAANATTTTRTTTRTTTLTLRLIEEILHYLSRLINFAPEECVLCLRQLLKYLFGRNYASGRHYPEFVGVYRWAARQWGEADTSRLYSDSTTGRITMINSKSCATGVPQTGVSPHTARPSVRHTHRNRRPHLNCVQDCRPLSELWSAVVQFHALKRRKPGPDPELGKHIKLFEPLVIHCLTVSCGGW